MTIRITSTISRSRLEPNAEKPWTVSSAANDPEAEPSLRYVLGTFGVAASFPEAISMAAAQRQSLDDELMEGVHESRSSRRAVVKA